MRPLLFALAVVVGCTDSAPPDAGAQRVRSAADARGLPEGEWAFVEVGGSVCRDGSPTGVGVRSRGDGANLLVYLEVGGACFNAATCERNPSRFGPRDFEALVGRRGDAGLFSTAGRNPVAGWTMVYVPYCTGDVHGGTRPDAEVPGVEGAQQFVGHRNLERALDALAPALGTPDTFLLAGASAGGFGTLVNFPELTDRYPDAVPALFNDSGPVFFDDAVLSPELGRTFAELYGFRDAFPADAAALFEPDGLQNVYAYLVERSPHARLGLVSALEDATIRYYFGFGQPDGEISGAEYAAALRGVRSRAPERWRTFYTAGDGHTFVGSDRAFFGPGTGPGDWLGALLAGEAEHVGGE